MQQVIENAKGWYVEVNHGSGWGRSYGTASVFYASDETLRFSETRNFIGPFDEMESAQAVANKENEYYDGSDYQ